MKYEWLDKSSIKLCVLFLQDQSRYATFRHAFGYGYAGSGPNYFEQYSAIKFEFRQGRNCYLFAMDHNGDIVRFERTKLDE